MSGFAKLKASIIHSTIWLESDQTRLLWITMLAMKDANGIIEASIPGLASAARIPVEACEDGLQKLMEPDPYSRTKEYEGRRIEEVDGGWRVLNHEKHREPTSTERVREWRKKQRETNETVSSVSQPTVTPETAPDPDPDPDKNKKGAPRKRAQAIPRNWKYNDKHEALAAELGVSCGREAETFMDHFVANGKIMKDWDAAFRNWLRRAKGFGGGAPPTTDTTGRAHVPPKPYKSPTLELPENEGSPEEIREMIANSPLGRLIPAKPGGESK